MSSKTLTLLSIFAIYSIGLFSIAIFREYKKYKNPKYTIFNIGEYFEFYVLAYWPVMIPILIFGMIFEKPVIVLSKIPKYVAHFLIRKFGDKDVNS